MKQPREADYKIQSRGDVLEVIFKSTDSLYEFRHIDGQLSPGQKTHRGPTGDAGDYSPTEVEDLARGLAFRHFKKRA